MIIGIYPIINYTLGKGIRDHRHAIANKKKHLMLKSRLLSSYCLGPSVSLSVGQCVTPASHSASVFLLFLTVVVVVVREPDL